MENTYTIIWTVHTYGNITEVVEKSKVKTECERLHKLSVIGGNEQKNTFKTIEVVNNETGEIREYWNNFDNQIQF